MEIVHPRALPGGDASQLSNLSHAHRPGAGPVQSGRAQLLAEKTTDISGGDAPLTVIEPRTAPDVTCQPATG